MNFIASRERLISALSLLCTVVQDAPMVNTLSSVRLTDGPVSGTINLTTTNYDVTISVAVPADVSSGYAICLPAQRLLELLKAFSDSRVSFDLKKKMKITCGNATSLLPVTEIDDFPVTVLPAKICTMNLVTSQFAGLLESARLASLKKGSAGILKSVCLRPEKDRLRAVGADGFRLIATSAPCKIDGIKSEWTLPVSTVNILTKALNSDDVGEMVRVLADDRSVSVESNNIMVQSRVITGKFPDHTSFISGDSQTIFSVDQNQILDALQVAKMSSDPDRATILHLVPSDAGPMLSVSAQDNKQTESEVLIPIEVLWGWDEHADTEPVGVSAVFLYVGVKSIGDQAKVDIGLNGPTGKVKITSDDSPVISIVMPVHINWGESAT